METQSRAGARAFRPIRMALEPRLMLDAAAVPAALAGAATDSSHAADPAPQPHSQAIFVFSDVRNWQEIAAAAPASSQVFVLSAGEDGVKAMADALRGQTGIEAVQIISHGEAGALSLGSAVLDAASVADHAEDFQTIGAALSANADMLFYGCDAGQGGSGMALAHALAEATGADIALSSDPTGATAKGGDWDLETQAGNIEAAALPVGDWDGLLQTTSTVDVGSGGVAANGAAEGVAVSQDGRYIAFTSAASNLIGGDTNGVTDVFRRDTQTGTTIRVSVSTASGQANGASVLTDMSDDGRYVVFSSTATNLVAGDTNGFSDVFVRDTQTNTTTRISVASNGSQGNGNSTGGSIAADGSRVAFVSSATNLVAGDTNGNADVFFRQMTGTVNTIRASGAGGANGNGTASAATINSDGNVIAFVSTSSNLVAGDTNAAADVFVYNIGTATTERVSVNSAGAQGSGGGAPSLSSDGLSVAFTTDSAFDAADTNGTTDIYLRNRTAGTTTLISKAVNGGAGNAASTAPSISGGGDYVAFTSAASNLVNGDTNGVTDVFVRDQTRTYRVSVSNAGAQANGASDNPALSSDGGQVAFRSVASNLDGTDGNPAPDIYKAAGYTVTPTDTGNGRNVRQMAGNGAAPPPSSPSPPPGPVMLGAPPPPPLGPVGGPVMGDPIHLTDFSRMDAEPPPRPAELSPAERLAMLSGEGLSIGDQRALLRGLPAGTIIDTLRASGDPAARAMAALMERVRNGEDVDVAEAKQVMAAEGVSQEKASAYLVALAQVEKAARTDKLAGALSILAADPSAADVFSREAGSPPRDIALTSNKVAILIGVQNYRNGLPPLGTPAADVNALSGKLAERFGYQTIVATDVGKTEIAELIRSVGDRLDGQGSLIIYYAGHGYAVESSGEGYWLPAGARTDSAAGWISTRDLSGYLGQVRANQIMVMSDSCYSGALTRDMRLTSDAIGQSRSDVSGRRSVTVLSSGGDEPVVDGGGNGHSVFADKLLNVLDKADGDAMGFQVFSQVRSEVTQAVPQEPTYGSLAAAGHAGRTDFIIGGR